MLRPQLQWTSPAPLWEELANFSEGSSWTRFREPTILGFASDDFMSDFMEILSSMPCQLGNWRAVWESWREPASLPPSIKALPGCASSTLGANEQESVPGGSIDGSTQPGEAKGLKLYQPAHQRYYLITACLVCRLPGLPDRVLDVNRGEQVYFVVRRLKREVEPEAGETTSPTTSSLGSFAEYAFVATPQGYQWQRVDLTKDLHPGEERLPLFGVTYTESDLRKRRLLTGLVPVGKREAYVGAETVEVNGTETEGGPDARWMLFYSEVVRPWQLLAEQDAKFSTRQEDSRAAIETEVRAELGRVEITDDAKVQAAISQVLADYNLGSAKDEAEMADQGPMASWYILLDLAEFLQKYLKDVWDALPDKTGEVEGAQGELLQALQAAVGGHTLGEALQGIEQHRSQLEGAFLKYEGVPDEESPEYWKSTLTYEPDDPSWLASFDLTEFADLVAEVGGNPSQLEDLVIAALESVGDPSAAVPSLPLAAQQRQVESGESYWYIIRCVFERPYCVLPSSRVVVSVPSGPFQLANFFDPEAPARPIRISLPLDTSPAGLRKFAKNTAFVMSDILTCQVGQIRDITLADLVLSVLPWPFHKPLPEPAETPCRSGESDAGMVCSLSIPIVTLCALILLIIMVNLFETFFRWIRYFIACFPIPGLRAKENV